MGGGDGENRERELLKDAMAMNLEKEIDGTVAWARRTSCDGISEWRVKIHGGSAKLSWVSNR